ncbi:ABC transporter substrate-binding protein [Sabulicella rubraurantiaca]|uniref:ABC transporter substrate-binding protein n=1 Tax=Sabulicella rubraurantiaca TaxID=2811429 RepID=UPI001A9704B2|nr:ABC transporter substrate-binding protein [Sabulicella rubraurantiaca]
MRIALAALALALAAGPAAAQPRGDLRVVVGNFGREMLDPALTTTQDLQYAGHIHDPLIAGDARGQLSSERGLAESWELSPDATTLTLRLRREVVWHDGRPFTSDDVVFTLGERLVAQDATCTFCRFLRSGIDRVEAPDAHTVTIRLKFADPTFPSILSSRDGDIRVLARHNYRRTDTGYELIGNPVGTGPWRFESFERGVAMRLAANTAYWDQGRMPQFATLRILPRAQPSTRLAMVRSGEADMAFIDPRQSADARRAGLRLHMLEGATINLLSFMGCWQPEMLCHRQELREAIAHAIDVNTIVARYYPEGSGRRVASSVWTEAALGFDPGLTPYRYDPRRARELLQSIGYDGRPVKIWVVPTNSNPEAPEIMQLVEGYLRAAGFRTEATSMEFGAFRPRYANDPQNFETRYAAHLYIDSPAARPTVIPNLSVSYISRQAGGIIQAYWNPERMDADFARLRGMTDLRELDEALREVNRRTYAEYAFVPVAARAVVAAVGPRVSGWSPGNFGIAWNLETVGRAD